MSSPQKIKGSQYERDVVKWLRSMGYPCAERAYGAGRHDDVGDIDGINGVVIECKNEKAIRIPQYLRELEDEMTHADAETGVVLIKKRGTSNISESYAVMPAELWVNLLKQAGYNGHQ
jgi:Holliday junction resolvase